jgi:polyadenylation factor subunit 2
MAVYEDTMGDVQFSGRSSRPFEGGIGLPRRPSRLFTGHKLLWMLLTSAIGPVTDYGSSMVQWMHTRRPRYKGAHRVETERPSASYTIDVS